MDSPGRASVRDCYYAGDLVIDVGRHTVNRAGIDIPLPRLSFDVLVALAEAHPRMLSIEELMESVWAPAVVNAETVSQRILLLRHSLGDHSASPRYIVGVRGRGYRFDAPVSREPVPTPPGVLHRTPEPADADKPPIIPTASAKTVKTERSWLYRIRQRYTVPGAALTILGALLLIACSLLWFARRSGHELGLQTSVTTVPRVLSDTVSALRTVPEHSIAVLPFVDMSEKHDQEYFADGLTDELIELLAKAPDLRVPARTSSFYFKGQHVSVADIAKALNVSHLLEGSVRKSGHTVRITVQLIRADNGYHVWSDSYDRDVKDVLRLQDDIATYVARELKTTLISGTHNAASPPIGSEAYDLYLQGLFNQRRHNLVGYRKAIDLYRQAVSADPTYALAWAQLSELYGNDAGSSGASSKEAYARAREAAARALELDPRLVEAHVAMGDIYKNYDWNWAAAEAEFKRALEVDPSSQTALIAFGAFARMMGRHTEAIQAFEQAVDRDPMSAIAQVQLGWVYWTDGRLTDAEARYREGMQLAPEALALHCFLGLIMLEGGQGERAVSEIQQEPDERLRTFGLAIATYGVGRKSDSDHLLAELIHNYGTHSGCQVCIAQVHAERGEFDDAFRWLEVGYEHRDSGVTGLLEYPFLRKLRGDPRYKALLTKMNLPG